MSQSAHRLMLTLAGTIFVAALIHSAELHMRFWWNDFRYFWTAGQLWLDGTSPYGNQYLAVGSAHFDLFSAPFYYPPASLPLLGILGLAEPRPASLALVAANIAACLGGCLLLARLGSRRFPDVDQRLWLAGLLIFVSLGTRHFHVNFAIGQLTPLFFFGLAAFLVCMEERRAWLASFALAFLLIKPQFGLGLFVFAAFTPGLRVVAARSAGLYAALSVAGLGAEPLRGVAGFFANMAAYTSHPVNLVSHAAGLSYLLSLVGVALGAISLCAIVATLSCAAGLVAARGGDRALLALATIVLGVFVTPTHATDYVILTPLLVLFDPRRDRLKAALIIAAMAVLGRSIDATLALGLEGAALKRILTIISTGGLLALCGAVIWKICNDHASRRTAYSNDLQTLRASTRIPERPTFQRGARNRS